MNPPVFELLKASAPVIAIVGSNPVRVFPGGTAPQASVLPYVCWSIVSGQPENVLTGRPPIDSGRVQVDCWAKTRDGAVKLYEAVRNALELASHEVSFNDDSQDVETKNWRRSSDFYFWVPRT